jgi:regulator of protease activity HflC (stomatin/prohibitin superfamily)
MTIQEKARQELRTAQRKLEEIKQDIERDAEQLKQEADGDAYGMTPGLSCSHAAIRMAASGTKYRATQNMIDTLTWLLADEQEEGAAV